MTTSTKNKPVAQPSPKEIFEDPVEYLAGLGIDSTLVAEIWLAVAA